MKTITLDDEAYERLRAWKRAPRESFTQVVKRVVPKPGTLAALVQFADTHRTGAIPADDIMEKAVESSRNPAKHDPWT